MGFLDFPGATGYNPLQDLLQRIQETGTNVPMPPGADAYAPQQSQPQQPSRNLFQSLGLGSGVIGDILKGSGVSEDNKDQPNLQMPPLGGPTARPPSMGPAPQDAFGSMPGVTSPVANPPMPPDRPPVPGLPTGMDIAGDQKWKPPVPPLPTGMDAAADKPWMPSDFTTTRQAGRDVPTGPLAQLAGAAAPVPPGVGGASPPPPEQSFLQKFITGGKPSGTQGIERFVSSVGAGVANAQGNGKFANAMRGFGGATAGSDKKQAQQFNEANVDFNNHMKMLLTGSVVERNEALAKLSTERIKYLHLPQANQSWRVTPYGMQIEADKDIAKFRSGKEATFRAGRIGMSSEEAAKEEARIDKMVDEYRQKKYSEYGIDPTKGAEGVKMQNPIDTSKKIRAPYIPGKDLHEQSPQFQKEFDAAVPSGAYYRLPDGSLHMRGPRAPQPDRLSATTPRADEAVHPRDDEVG